MRKKFFFVFSPQMSHMEQRLKGIAAPTAAAAPAPPPPPTTAPPARQGGEESSDDSSDRRREKKKKKEKKRRGNEEERARGVTATAAEGGGQGRREWGGGGGREGGMGWWRRGRGTWWRQTPPPRRDSPSPRLMGLRRWGPPSPVGAPWPVGGDHRLGGNPCPPGRWTRAIEDYHPPCTLRGRRPPPREDSFPPAGGPAPSGAATPRRCSVGSGHRLGGNPRYPSCKAKGGGASLGRTLTCRAAPSHRG